LRVTERISPTIGDEMMTSDANTANGRWQANAAS
jgi:hypothetical protein